MAVLLDKEFLGAIDRLYRTPLDKEVAFKFFALSQGITKAIGEFEERRDKVLEKYYVLNNNGKPKMVKGKPVLKDEKAATDEVMALITKEGKINNKGLRAEDFNILPPMLIPDLAIISQVLDK